MKPKPEAAFDRHLELVIPGLTGVGRAQRGCSNEMKKILMVLAVVGLPFASQAQEDEAAQRSRIAAERAEAQAAFQAREKECYTRFAVNDCLNDAKAQRQRVLADLRRQEIAIDDAQRKRKAAEHLRSVDERAAADKQEQQARQRADAASEYQQRQAQARRKAAERAAGAASAPARALSEQEAAARKQAQAGERQKQRAQEAARNVQQRNERLAKAQERKAARDKREAERRKSPANPLPEPPQ